MIILVRQAIRRKSQRKWRAAASAVGLAILLLTWSEILIIAY